MQADTHNTREVGIPGQCPPSFQGIAHVCSNPETEAEIALTFEANICNVSPAFRAIPASTFDTNVAPAAMACEGMTIEALPAAPPFGTTSAVNVTEAAEVLQKVAWRITATVLDGQVY